MQTFLTVIHVLVALFMILVVLVQGGNQGGVAAAFGGGNTSGFFGASGASTFLGKLTYVAAAIFMITSISLTVIHGKGGNIDLKKRLEQMSEQQNTTAPAEAQKPAEATTAPATQP
jgi:preprotein translocase subunit SecG